MNDECNLMKNECSITKNKCSIMKNECSIMKNECSIIRDLLPLYVENMVSSDTADFVEEHLKGCEACRKEYERAKEPQPVQEISSTLPLLKLQRKMKTKKIQTIALTAVFLIALFVSAFAVLDTPIYFPYSEGIVNVEPFGVKGMLLTFDEEVTDFSYTVYDDPDGGGFCYCEIEAWTSLWDRWFSRGKGALSATVVTQKAEPMIAVYVPNNGSENVYVAKYDPENVRVTQYGPNAGNRIEMDVDYKGSITLPRLSLGYNLILAVAAFAVLGIVWLLTREETKVRVWVERIGLYPVAYLASHCIVSGINWATYSLPRDFSLIIFISILLYSGLLLAHNIWRLKREIKEINQV